MPLITGDSTDLKVVALDKYELIARLQRLTIEDVGDGMRVHSQGHRRPSS